MTSIVFDQKSWLMLNDNKVYTSGRSLSDLDLRLRVVLFGKSIKHQIRRFQMIQENLGTFQACVNFVGFENFHWRIPLTAHGWQFRFLLHFSVCIVLDSTQRHQHGIMDNHRSSQVVKVTKNARKMIKSWLADKYHFGHLSLYKNRNNF